jgi:hypothetical protein
MSELIRRVQARGRENSSFAESRVRKNFTESARWWAIVAALPPRLRGITVDVDAMQRRKFTESLSVGQNGL